jgi:hypothetical protein
MLIMNDMHYPSTCVALGSAEADVGGGVGVGEGES